MPFIGRHVSIAGGIESSFSRAEELGCTAMQIFVTNPRGWRLSAIPSASEEAFRKKATGIVSVAHMPYLPNIASPNRETFAKSVRSLFENMERCDKLGIGYLVTHMGSHLGSGKEKGLENVAKAVSAALEVDTEVRILLENEAGHNNSVGDRIEDLAGLAERIKDRRLGFCLDTCHLFAAGYDIADHGVLDDIFSVLGMDRVHVLHINDAKRELGSHLDRHENIGYGHIGVEGFRRFLGYRNIASKTLILETPVGNSIGEAEEIALVKGLVS